MDQGGGGDEEIESELEPIFDELDRVMYEVRNAVRGYYGVRGKNVEDLVAKLNEEVNKELKNICEELKGAVTLRLLQDCFNPMNAIGPIICT